jgi:hypothetical protein
MNFEEKFFQLRLVKLDFVVNVDQDIPVKDFFTKEICLPKDFIRIVRLFIKHMMMDKI